MNLLSRFLLGLVVLSAGLILVVFEYLMVKSHGFKGDSRGVIVFFVCLGIGLIGFGIRFMFPSGANGNEKK